MARTGSPQIITFGTLQARAVLRDVGGCVADTFRSWTGSPRVVPNNTASRSPRRGDGKPSPSCRQAAGRQRG